MSSFVQDICQLLIHLLSATHLKEGFLTGIHFIIKKVFYLILGEFLFRIFSRNFTISGIKSFLFFPRQIRTFYIFIKKICTFFCEIALNIFIYPTTLSNHLGQYVFCCYFFFFGLFSF